MDTVIEFNDAAFNHNISKSDIRRAFDTAIYDGWFNEGKGQDKDKYLLIGFGRNGILLEILYNIIDRACSKTGCFVTSPCSFSAYGLQNYIFYR
jgi:hypothetical protein